MELQITYTNELRAENIRVHAAADRHTCNLLRKSEETSTALVCYETEPLVSTEKSARDAVTLTTKLKTAVRRQLQ